MLRGEPLVVRPNLPYNHDIDVEPTFAARFPGIASLLRHERLITLFKQYDAIAKSRKARMQLLGRLTLVLTLFSLLGVIGELLAVALHAHPHYILAVVIELLALSAFVCVLVNHRQHNRSKYLLACFSRERLRHWFFQLFLDGEFVSRIATDHDAVAAELDDRFATFREHLRNTDGLLLDYLDSLTRRSSLLHKPSAYSSQAIASEVCSALSVLRLDHQARYPRRKIAEDPNDQQVSIREQNNWAETVARISLMIAVAIPVLQLLVICWRLFGATSMNLESTHLILLALAVGFAVISATARAYCAGMTLPEELDSYTHYIAHVDAIRAVYNDTSDTDTKLSCFLELEVEAERELRRFIRMKQRATFLA